MQEYEKKMLLAYTGLDSYEYYQKVFEKLESGKKWSWNWSAFFFGFSFMVLRNNSLGGILFLLLGLFNAIVVPFLAKYVYSVVEYNEHSVFLALSFILLLRFIVWLLEGGFANVFLLKRYKDLKAKFEKKYEDEDKRLNAMEKAGKLYYIFASISLSFSLGVMMKFFM